MQGLSETRGQGLSHPLIAEPSHDELVEQLFIRDLKIFVGRELATRQNAIAAGVEAGMKDVDTNNRVEYLRDRMLEFDSFPTWIEMQREAQRQLWSSVGNSVARQAGHLEALADIPDPNGSVRVNPDFVAPAYIADADIHLMPGGYAHDDGSVLQGALMDRGGAVYMLGRNGGMLNDQRGQTAMAHVLTVYPDLDPKRILDMGCGIGASTVPAAICFPEAEVHAIDVGASVLRYAHARAEHLGAAIHFSQQSAERTDFEAGSFDLVFTCAVLHETSQSALSNIFAEARRLLRPGGVAVHLEVPLEIEDTAWAELSAELEAEYNNEPYWRGALSGDYGALMSAAGLKDVQVGYQATSAHAREGALKFGSESEGVFRSWFVTSGRA